jgi:hypothetical protein
MTDCNGRPILVGARCRFRVGLRVEPVIGTVRTVDELRDQVRCDDGDHDNSDLFTNHFRLSAWVSGGDVEIE